MKIKSSKLKNYLNKAFAGKKITEGSIRVTPTGLESQLKLGTAGSVRTNFAKLAFAANKIPFIDVETDDEAYFERWIVFEFDNKFEPGDKKTKPTIWKTIVEDKNEMSGILNWGLIGLKRLLGRNMFSFNKTSKEIRELMMKENSVIGFLKFP